MSRERRVPCSSIPKVILHCAVRPDGARSLDQLLGGVVLRGFQIALDEMSPVRAPLKIAVELKLVHLPADIYFTIRG